jgi:hypothetical protein
VQLQRSFEKPAYVVEPPRRKLDRALDKERHTGANWEAKIRSEQLRPTKFQQPLPQKFDERNPPPTDDIPDGPGARKLDHADRNGVPAFLDRRKANVVADDSAEPTFVDLVTGGGR